MKVKRGMLKCELSSRIHLSKKDFVKKSSNHNPRESKYYKLEKITKQNYILKTLKNDSKDI